MCEYRRFPVVERAIAKRNCDFDREGRLGKWGMVDVKGMREIEGAVVLVCFGEEGAAGPGAPMAGCMTSAIVCSRVRSQGTMDRDST